MCLHKQTPAPIQQGGKQVYPAAAEHREYDTTIYSMPVDEQYHKWYCLKNKE
jgi:hypothetical protein